MEPPHQRVAKKPSSKRKGQGWTNRVDQLFVLLGGNNNNNQRNNNDYVDNSKSKPTNDLGRSNSINRNLYLSRGSLNKFDKNSFYLKFSLNQYSSLCNSYFRPILCMPTPDLDLLWESSDDMIQAEVFGMLSNGAMLLGHHKEAADFAAHARNLMKDLFDVIHPRVAASQFLLASYHFLMGDYEKAYVYATQAQNMAKVLMSTKPNLDYSARNLILASGVVTVDCRRPKDDLVRTLNTLQEFSTNSLQTVQLGVYHAVAVSVHSMTNPDSDNLRRSLDELSTISNQLENLDTQLAQLLGNTLKLELQLLIKSHIGMNLLLSGDSQNAVLLADQVYDGMAQLMMNQRMVSFISTGTLFLCARIHKETLCINAFKQDIELMEWLARAYPTMNNTIADLLNEFTQLGFKSIGTLNIEQYYTPTRTETTNQCSSLENSRVREVSSDLDSVIGSLSVHSVVNLFNSDVGHVNNGS